MRLSLLLPAGLAAVTTCVMAVAAPAHAADCPPPQGLEAPCAAPQPPCPVVELPCQA